VIPADFSLALAQLTPEPTVNAFRVPSKLILYGRWLKHAGMYPTYQVRLGRRDSLRFIQVGHGQREAPSSGVVATFPVAYLHYSFSCGMRAWLEKHIRYAKDEAALIEEVRRGVRHETAGTRHRAKRAASSLPHWTRPFARFVYVYCIRAGFLDGRVGLAYAIMLSVYEGMIAVFAYERSMR
jgi:hypothetical protein